MTSYDLKKVTNAIIMPFIDMAVSADYLNQMTCWWFEDLCSDIGTGSCEYGTWPQNDLV